LEENNGRDKEKKISINGNAPTIGKWEFGTMKN